MNDIIKNTLDVISEYTNIPIDDILSKKRNEEIVDARFMAIYILNIKYDITYTILKKQFNMTKPGIWYAVKSFIERIKSKMYLKSTYFCVLNDIKERVKINMQ